MEVLQKKTHFAMTGRMIGGLGSGAKHTGPTPDHCSRISTGGDVDDADDNTGVDGGDNDDNWEASGLADLSMQTQPATRKSAYH